MELDQTNSAKELIAGYKNNNRTVHFYNVDASIMCKPKIIL